MMTDGTCENEMFALVTEQSGLVICYGGDTMRGVKLSS